MPANKQNFLLDDCCRCLCAVLYSWTPLSSLLLHLIFNLDGVAATETIRMYSRDIWGGTFVTIRVLITGGYDVL